MTDNLDMAITDIDELERDAKINGGVTIGVGTVEYLVGRIRAAEAAHRHVCGALETSNEIRSSIDGALSRLHAEKDAAFACEPFAWSDIKPVRGTSVVNPSVMLLDADGACIGLVHVLSARDDVVRGDVERAMSAAGNPAKMRRFMQAARNGEAEANERADAAETRVKSAEAALQPFRSGGDWGSVKAWIVGKGFQNHGTRVAKQITEWQTVVDAVLAEG